MLMVLVKSAMPAARITVLTSVPSILAGLPLPLMLILVSSVFRPWPVAPSVTCAIELLLFSTNSPVMLPWKPAGVAAALLVMLRVLGGGPPSPCSGTWGRKAVSATRRGKAVTLRDCAARHIAGHKVGWRNPKHAAQWAATLATYAGPVMGGLSVQAIDTALVLKVLEPIWTTKPETAGRVRGRME